MNPRTPWCALLSLATLAVPIARQPIAGAAGAAADSEPRRPEVVSLLTRPSKLLVREPLVQGELNLSPSQVSSIDALLEKADRVLWPLRDLPPEQGNLKARPAIAEFEANLATILEASQGRRLGEIVLQADGPQHLAHSELIQSLQLDAAQQKRITRVLTDTRKAFAGLETLTKKGTSQDKINEFAQALREQQWKDVSAVLNDTQRRQWMEMLGTPFDTSRLMGMAFKAPEIRPAEAWVNTQPLTLAQLRGQVVILNFYAFGCGNCVNNYPAYKRWHQAYADKGVTLLSIHTPETKGERNIDSVRQKATENGLAWPILVDNSKANWDAWANAVWPSVYLIDKRGNIRYWWYGELNWQKTQGEAIMRGYIDRLLAEPAPPSTQATSSQAAEGSSLGYTDTKLQG